MADNTPGAAAENSLSMKDQIMARLTSLLHACHIDTRQPLPNIALSLLLQPSAIKTLDWQKQRAEYFPHVDFYHLHWSDLLRIPLQILWLLLVLPPENPQKSQPPAWINLLAKNWGKAWQKIQKGLLLPARLNIQAWQQQSEVYAGHRFWHKPMVRHVAYGLATLLALLCITTPFSIMAQTIFVSILWGLAMLARRIPGQVTTLFMVVLSITASSRYLWWRLTSTLNWDETLDLFWGLLLLSAELYTWCVLILGYFQTAWPLRREPAPLPEDTEFWPRVDIYIPSYNEPLKVVKPTVYAALELDWPKDKLRVYILDDGRRDEFRDFAAAANCGYLIRPDNRHAKAGNINHALPHTTGEFIAIFDCDHIPVRSFLQTTMGLFLQDKKLALVQTPHHFFSPDPFERNLGTFRNVPNEGELFYGVIQPANDLWNATFFCGSCAVIRRTPLEEVGGIAVETVTEDAHTALRLQRRGYNTAYLKTPQAAGLATESLSAHIGQRIRWARGMAQILRLDNPFLGKGLNWQQRICYGNAMIHFMNGLPRLIFLTAPLAFLLFHAYVIYAQALAVALYVLPHMVHANLTNSRIQGEHRHSFWAEVYETVLAWYIARPTTVALLNPHKGKFNVTAKGGLVTKEYFDWSIAWPYVVLILLNILGAGFGIWRMISGPSDEIATVGLNLFWTVYNLLLLGGAVAVAAESRQVRLTHRVSMKIPATLHLPGGQLVVCHTEDFSEGGTALVVPEMSQVKLGDQVQVSLWRGNNEQVFPAKVVSLAPSQVRLRWEAMTMAQESSLIQCTFARADAWVNWAEKRSNDKPIESLAEILALGLEGFRRLGEFLLPVAGLPKDSFHNLHNSLASLLPRHPKIPASGKA